MARRFFAVSAAALLALLSTSVTAATVYTGDRADGVPIIARLDLADLAPGKRVLLVAGVHGDDLNPIRVVQQVFADLDSTALSGSVIGIIAPSRPGGEQVARMWPTSNLAVMLVNPNRTSPGTDTGNSVERRSWLIMNGVIKGNADVGADLHTGGNGIDFALFAFASAKDAEAQQIARLFPIDRILLDPGFDDALEYALVRAGIPAITLELGGPRRFDPAMIKAGVTGARNILVHHGSSGRVAIIGTDAVRERGVDVVSILIGSKDCPAAGCACAGDET